MASPSRSGRNKEYIEFIKNSCNKIAKISIILEEIVAGGVDDDDVTLELLGQIKGDLQDALAKFVNIRYNIHAKRLFAKRNKSAISLATNNLDASIEKMLENFLDDTDGSANGDDAKEQSTGPSRIGNQQFLSNNQSSVPSSARNNQQSTGLTPGFDNQQRNQASAPSSRSNNQSSAPSSQRNTQQSTAPSSQFDNQRRNQTRLSVCKK